MDNFYVDHAPLYADRAQQTPHFTSDDFTAEELQLLKAIFSGADAVVESLRYGNSDVYWVNTLYDLKEKLGIGGVV